MSVFLFQQTLINPFQGKTTPEIMGYDFFFGGFKEGAFLY
jgi:hypothetical protein